MPSLLIPAGNTRWPYRAKTGVLQMPAWQLPRFELQAVLSATAGFEHVPVDVLQVPAVWHESWAVQLLGLLPTHAPFWQVSVCVHMLPSLQFVPLAALVGVGHCPVEGTQLPATWQVGAEHCFIGPGTQLPDWQLSPTVHMFPSLQVVLSATLVGVGHVPVAGLQLPAT